MPELTESFFLEIWIWLGLAGLGGLLLGLVRLLRPELFQRLLPPQRQRDVPWSGYDVLFAFVISFLFFPMLAHVLVGRANFLTAYYGPDFRLETKDDDDEAAKLDRVRRNLWTTAAAFPLQIAFTLALFSRSDPRRLYQLGLSGSRAVKDVILAFMTWLAISPCVLGLNLLVVLMYQSWPTMQPEEHPISELIKGTAGDRVLMFVVAVLAAPVLEELYFRGLLQPWAGQSETSYWQVVGAAVFVSVFLRSDKLQDGTVVERLGNGMVPALFILALAPGEPLFRRAFRFVGRIGSKSERRAGISESASQAIYATSLLFASFHASVWPSPIALFPLSLGLGWLAYRTQSLIGPIVVHALFNLISALALLVGPVPSPPPPETADEAASARSSIPSNPAASAMQWRDR